MNRVEELKSCLFYDTGEVLVRCLGRACNKKVFDNFHLGELLQRNCVLLFMSRNLISVPEKVEISRNA